MKFYFDDIDLSSLLGNLVESLTPAAKEKKIHLTGDIEKNMPHLNADMSRLTEVFENILSNAIKFTEKGGVKASAKSDGKNILVSLSDTGMGMGKKFLNTKLFGKFQQEDSTERRKYGGTGLGMAISKQIVEKHGGKIWAESEIGKGTTFFVSLPIKKE